MKILLPFAWLYSALIWARNKAFDWGILKTTNVGVPVISVGNLTVGGTGKTPLVEYLVKQLLAEERRVAVVSRGYKRKSSGVVVVADGKKILATATQGGDEPVQIAEKFPQAIVVVGEKRVEAAQRAVELGATVILADDCFQHRYLHRDLNVVVVDSTLDITKDAILPAGRLRESLQGLRRADVVALSKFDENASLDLALKLRPYFKGSFIQFRYKLVGVKRAKDDATVSHDVVRGMKLVAFSGIGNHDAFIVDLQKNGFAPISDMRFPDHHAYSENDVSTLAAFTRAMAADGCITTEKDVVRLRSDRARADGFFKEIPVFYLRIEVEIVEGKETLHSLTTNCGKAIYG